MEVLASTFGQLVAGWLFADLLAGIFHWWEDRLAGVDMPIVGKWLIAPNRLHHRDPMAFTRGSVLERSLAAGLASCLLAAAWLIVFGFSAFWLAMFLGGLAATEVHRLAHLGRQDGIVGALQEIGLFQSPSHHAGHHRGLHDRRYCVLTNWLNPVLDRLRVWHVMEAGLMRLGVRTSAPGSDS